MGSSASKSADDRISGKHQVDEQRAMILEAAEKLFLESGIENTRMIDIAKRAGITRVTLYRYFANRDEVAVEVHLRLMNKTAQMTLIDPQDHSLEGHKRRILAIIRSFPVQRDRFRYTGMFDKIYLDNPPDSALTRWTFNQLISAGFIPPAAEEGSQSEPYGEEITVILNTVVWFLEKLALRGELTWSNKEVPLEEHLRVFEDMVMGYFDQLIAARDRRQSSDIQPGHIQE